MKTYVITLSKKFPGYHHRKGDQTYFESGIVMKRKKHTIRGNYAYWKKRIDAINRGEAILSVRQWIDKPYKQPGQIEIYVLKAGEVGIQKCNVEILKDPEAGEYASIDINKMPLFPNWSWQNVAQNDGLSPDDFIAWFKEPIIDGCIIHFTDLTY